MSFVAIAVIAATVFVLAIGGYAFVVAFARRLFNARSRRWKSNADKCIKGLTRAGAPLPVDPRNRALLLGECWYWTLSWKDALDRALTLRTEGRRLLAESRLSHLWLPTRLTRRFRHLRIPSSDAAALRKKLHALQTARLQTLKPVDDALDAYLPDLRKQLGALPLQTSTLAVGALTLVGFVWLTGYYGVLGITFLPLLSDIKDVALIGLTSGVVPLTAFASMVLASLIRIETAKSAARKSSVSATRIARALVLARDVRRIKFWAWRTIPCFGLLFLIALDAAATLEKRLDYTMSFDGSEEVAKAALVGSIGDFVIISQYTSATPVAARRIVAMRRDQLRCVRSGGLEGRELDTCVGARKNGAPCRYPRKSQ